MKDSLMEKADKYIAGTYARIPVVMEKGSGCTLWDSEGRKYTDFLSGIAVCALGHSHPVVTSAITEQAQKLLHVSNLFYTGPQAELAEFLVEHSFGDKVFFGNSGAEANEAAIKLARKYFSDKGEEKRKNVIAMTQSFHGRTMATLSATGQDKIKEGFTPLLPGFDFVPFNDFSAIEAAADDTTCAILIEPVQGEGGVLAAAPGYLEEVRAFCDKTGILLIFDEIQTGMGRCGRLFAHEHYNVTPDIMTLAKALGNGLPIGAMVATEKVAASFGPGAHGSTFGGSPLAAAAALATAKELAQGGVIDHGQKMGLYFREKLTGLKERHPNVVSDVRGLGLLLGMKLSMEGAKIVSDCLENGFVINCVQGDILRFVPPLIITEDEIDALVGFLDGVFDKLD